jgi:hypothetical protein
MLSFMLLNVGLVVFGLFSEGIGTVVKVVEARTGRKFPPINHTDLDGLPGGPHEHPSRQESPDRRMISDRPSSHCSDVCPTPGGSKVILPSKLIALMEPRDDSPKAVS